MTNLLDPPMAHKTEILSAMVSLFDECGEPTGIASEVYYYHESYDTVVITDYDKTVMIEDDIIYSAFFGKFKVYFEC